MAVSSIHALCVVVPLLPHPHPTLPTHSFRRFKLTPSIGKDGERPLKRGKPNEEEEEVDT